MLVAIVGAALYIAVVATAMGYLLALTSEALSYQGVRT
jgi:hypothetical protein